MYFEEIKRRPSKMGKQQQLREIKETKETREENHERSNEQRGKSTTIRNRRT
jgi:hypothetical protein